MSTSDWTMQFLTDIPGGASGLAIRSGDDRSRRRIPGRHGGCRYPHIEAIAARWAAERRFKPAMSAAERAERYRGCQDAMARTLLRP
jgi:glycerol kinase